MGLLGRLFAEPTVSHRGTYYTVHEACIEPSSIQLPRVPIAIAAAGAKAIAVAAGYGDAWITFGDASHRDRSAAATDEIVRGRCNGSTTRARRSAGIRRRSTAST